ncbi:MAG: helix-turn-helix domain-containing protein [Bacteroidetes bacterium]|nr:helix-turn-helix domain-containing protein [Bacteroidota bacterium]
MQVTILVPNGKANLNSIAGPYEILKKANSYWEEQGRKSVMNINVAGSKAEIVLSSGIFSIHPAHINTIKKADLIIVPACAYTDVLVKDNAELIEWMREQYKNGAELSSICSGAFLLAATGLLEGKPCSTHWNLASDFRRLYPNVKLLPDRLITSEKGIYTNGGAFSFLNLMLFLVEKYFDRATAIYCSKVFQIDMERNSQSHFLIFETQKNHGDEMVSKAQQYIEDNMTEKISFEALAAQLAVSRRNFDRRFIKATGNTPVEYLQRVKVEAAKRVLEKGRKTVFEAMSEVGYTDDKAFREVFKKITGLSPLDYRAKYNKTVAIA